jgi:hypothetical protein
MQMRFEVGDQERHVVVFSFDKFWGGLSIKVDGQPVKQELQLASLRLVKRWEFSVGQQEQHAVMIEKERKALFAGFRPQICRAYVDGQQVAEATA